MGLGEAEAADDVTGRHAGQPSLALLLGAVGVDRVHAQAGLHRHETAQAGIAALQFLADQAVGNRVEPGAAVTLDAGTQQAQ